MSRKKPNRLLVTPLEDRQTPAAAAAVAAPFALGVPDGQTGDVTVYNADGTTDYTITAPYAADFSGGVRVTMADVTGDGTADVITAPGPGSEPLVKVYDGSTHALVASFDAYESTFTGGVYVTAADLNGDGAAEIITGADQGGGPRVIVFDGASVNTMATDSTATPTKLDNFLAIDDANFRGGVRLATGDVNGDGTADLVVGAGYGGGPRVVVYDGAALANGQQTKLVNDFFAFEAGLRNGVFPAVGDLNGDGCGDLIFGAGYGGGPRVLGLDGRAALSGVQSELANFFAGAESSRLGVEVGTTTDSSGNTGIIGCDLATNSTGLFGANGAAQGQLGGLGHSGHPAFGPGNGSTPIAVTSNTATALTGTSYTGSGTGTLTTYTRGSAPTSADATASITLDITGATLA